MFTSYAVCLNDVHAWSDESLSHVVQRGGETLAAGDTLGEILATLARHNILSAPVVEKTSGRYSGFVDVAGILSIFVKGCRRWLSREYGTSMGSDTPAMPPTGQKETIGVNPGTLREEGYAMRDENALLQQLQSSMGAGMFQRTLRAVRAEYPAGYEGDGEAIYRGYLQASLLSVISAAFLHPITERRLMPPSLSGTLACNHRVGVYDWDPAFDDGSKVTDLSSFEIVSQSDVVRFLHVRRDDELLRRFAALTVREVGLLKTQHSRRHAREGEPGGEAGSASPSAPHHQRTRTPDHSLHPGLSLFGRRACKGPPLTIIPLSSTSFFACVFICF